MTRLELSVATTLADGHVASFFASLGMETFHTLSTLAHALFRYRLVSSFAQTPRVEAPIKKAGERAAPPLIGRPL